MANKKDHGLSGPDYDAIRRRVFEESGGICAYCDKPLPVQGFHLDHIEPRAVRGATARPNLVVCHNACNARGGHRIYRDFEHKRAVIRERLGL